MCVILPLFVVAVKLEGNYCGRLVDNSELSTKLLIRKFPRGQIAVTIRVDPVQHDIVVSCHLIWRDARHTPIQSPALTHATDALMLADERLESFHAIEKVDRLHCVFHARELHVTAIPVFANRNDELAQSRGRVEALVTLCSRFFVAHAIIIAIQAGYATPSGDASGNISDIL